VSLKEHIAAARERRAKGSKDWDFELFVADPPARAGGRSSDSDGSNGHDNDGDDGDGDGGALASDDLDGTMDSVSSQELQLTMKNMEGE